MTLSCHQKTPPKIVYFSVGGAPHEIQFWKTLIADFHRQSGIEVRLVRQLADTGQRRQELLINLKAKQSDPDLFLMDVAWVSQFAASGWLTPLDHQLGLSDVGVFFREIVNRVDRYENELYALPVFIDGGLLYYRRDLLEKYGYSHPPKTWDELEMMATHIQTQEQKIQPGFNGFLWQGSQYEGLVCNFIEVAASGHGGIYIQNNRLLLNTAENRRALQRMNSWIHHLKVSPFNTFTEMKEENVRRLFQRGLALFERNWPYAWELHQDIDSPVRGLIGVALLPRETEGKHVSALGGWHLAISQFSDAKQEAAQLAAFVLSYESQKKLALSLGLNPGRRDIYDDPEIISAMPHLPVLKQAFDHAVARPPIPYYTQLSEVIQQALNSALAGEKGVEEALIWAENQAQRIITRYEP